MGWVQLVQVGSTAETLINLIVLEGDRMTYRLGLDHSHIMVLGIYQTILV